MIEIEEFCGNDKTLRLIKHYCISYEKKYFKTKSKEIEMDIKTLDTSDLLYEKTNRKINLNLVYVFYIFDLIADLITVFLI